MNKIILIFTLLGLLACKNDSIATNTNEVVWLDAAKADALDNSEGKKYFVDMYTSWCGWCKVMDNKTFNQPEVIKFMNENFHSVKFDAEQREAVKFNNKEYVWQAGGRNGINMFAMEMLGGQLSYPSYVILNEQKQPIKVLVGFMETQSFLSAVQPYAKQ